MNRPCGRPAGASAGWYDPGRDTIGQDDRAGAPAGGASMSVDDITFPRRARDKTQRRRNPLLAVRAMAGEIAWLDGRLHWQAGRVAWLTEAGAKLPTPDDLALAQRRLYQIAGFPVAAPRALGDAAGWLAARQARLEVAKQLQPLHEPDLATLAAATPTRDERAIGRLLALLPAEALCVNALPASPSAALLICGGAAAPGLLRICADPAAPPAAGALAALALGALAGRGGAAGSPPPAGRTPGADWRRRAFAWGAAHGLSPWPALTVALLADGDGERLAARCWAALRRPDPPLLPAELARDLLADGQPPARVVAVVEANAATDSLIERLGARGALPPGPAHRRRAAAQERRRVSGLVVASLAELMPRLVRAEPDPALVGLAARFTHRMLDVEALSEPLAAAVDATLRAVLALPPHVRRPGLTLLIDEHERLWRRDWSDAARAAWGGAHWLTVCGKHHVEPLLRLLAITGDVDVAHEAARQRLHTLLADFAWRDADDCRWLLALAPHLSHRAVVSNVAWLLTATPEARAWLQPLTPAPSPANRAMHGHVLEMVLESIPMNPPALREALPRLTRFLPTLVRFADADKSEWRRCTPVIHAALALDRADPEQAAPILDWLIRSLLNRQGEWDWEDTLRLGLLVRLTPLASGDLGRLRAIMDTTIQRVERYQPEQLEAGVRTLRRFTAVCAAIAHLFPRQPARCLDLLVRAGLAARLGSAGLPPLSRLALSPTGAGAPDGWEAVLASAPELASLAAAYRHARAVLGRDASPPPGVRAALDEPARRAAELAYLERLAASQPERAELTIRAARLRARLADGADMARAARREATERLAEVTAEAQLAAAERQMLACYRARLEAVARPLPPAAPLDDDLLNAALLTLDIRQNRKWLLRLLRAYLDGDRRWIERLPANVAFLRALAERGVDATAWLGDGPRRFACPGVAGGRVRLHLEREPLRILQMGNYFDTCLSFGQMNAFSTVANAVELNKRVVYAADGAGRIVGRKLIAINTLGALVGFRTYTALADARANAALRAVFRRFLTDFAARCGLAWADGGEVATLFVEAWYDDGICSWDDDEMDADGGTDGRAAGPTRHAFGRSSDPSPQESRLQPVGGQGPAEASIPGVRMTPPVV
jgi:hypothetical protein